MSAYVRCLAAALLSRRNVTFLECVMRLQGNCTQRNATASQVND
jgi:hypothetical protein